MRKHFHKIISFFSICSIIALVLYISYDIKSEPLKEDMKIRVEVRGRVKEEQIYTLDKGTIMQDLLDLVELEEDADISGFSLQSILYNNELIIIPQQSSKKLISINSAELSELCLLPGIGEKTAQKIIEYREEVGSFLTLEEIMKVHGIGSKKFAKIKEYITL